MVLIMTKTEIHNLQRRELEALCLSLIQVGFRCEVRNESTPILFKYNEQTGLGTVVLGEYDRGTWRWYVDHYGSWAPSPQISYKLTGRRGAYREFQGWAGPRNLSKIEITCALSEISSIGQWLPFWIVARDNRTPIPALPCPAYERHRLRPWDYLWTTEANRLYGFRPSPEPPTRFEREPVI